MASKKLKVEVELDTEKAKRQAKELERSGSGASGSSVATSTPKSADNLAKSLDRASRSVVDFGEKSKASSTQIAGVVRSFAGLGVGMAISYAAKNMERGSARTAVETAGGAVQGASAASAALMALPGGALVKGALTIGGAAIGGWNAYLENRAEQANFSKDFEKGEAEYQAGREWAAKFKELTGIMNTDMGLDELEASVQRITDELDILNSGEKNRVASIKAAIEAGKLDQAQREREELATQRSKIAQLEAVRDNYNKQIEAEKKKNPESDPAFRASLGGTDALQKIGMDVAGASDVIKVAAASKAVSSVTSTSSRGFSWSSPERGYQEMQFGNFEKQSSDFRIITPLESAERNGRMSLDTLNKIYQEIVSKKGGSAWQ